MSEPIKIEFGKEYWYFNSESGSNRYPKKALILGETSRSWLTDRGNEWYWRESKLPHWAVDIYDSIEQARQKESKRLPKKHVKFITAEEGELYLWGRANQYAIGARVSGLSDWKLLKQIADLIGFEESQAANGRKGKPNDTKDRS